MDQKMSANETLKRYLLGELPRYQRKQIEREFFENSESLKQLLDVERKLFADYKHGALDERDRLLFEQQFPGGVQKSRWINENADELAQIGLHVTGHESSLDHRKSSWLIALLEQLRKPKVMLQFAFAGAMVLLAAILFTIFVWSRDPNTVTEPRRAQSNEPTPSASQPSPQEQSSVPTPDQKNSSSPMPSPALTPHERTAPLLPQKVVVATLVPGLLRGNAVAVPLNPDDTVVRLQVRLFDSKHESYSGDLRNKDRRVIKQLATQRPRTHDGIETVDFEVSTSLLVEDFYYVTLYGRSSQGKQLPLDTYPFIVERK